MCTKLLPLVGHSPLVKKRQCVHVNWRNSSNLNPNPVPLNRFTACLAEHTLGPLSLGTVSLTCWTLYRDCRQGQKVETSRKKCSSPVNFTYYFFLRTVKVVVVNQGDTLGQVRSPQLRSFTPGPKPPWIHSLIVHLYFWIILYHLSNQAGSSWKVACLLSLLAFTVAQPHY